MIKCRICGVDTNYKTYCSLKCRNIGYIKEPKNICKICGIKTKNEVFCSEKCQHENIRGIEKIERENRKCILCGYIFRIRKTKKNRYCSRKCKDEHQKILYSGKGSPVYGRKAPKEERDWHSIIMKEAWKDAEYVEKIKKGIQKYKENNEYSPGWDPASIQKRKQTLFRRYGVEHNWQNEEIREKCEITCLERYGNYSWEIGQKELFRTKSTKIENILENILIKNNVVYSKSFRVYYDSHKFKVYDFFINKKILLECDGDYWHANPDIFFILNDIQRKNAENDVFKNNLAQKGGFILLRFWETEILKNDFEQSFLECIKKYE